MVCLLLVFESRIHRIHVFHIGLTIENINMIYAFRFTVNTKYTTKNKLCYNRDYYYYYGWWVGSASVAMAHTPILNRLRRCTTIYIIENENENERKTKPVF